MNRIKFFIGLLAIIFLISGCDYLTKQKLTVEYNSQVLSAEKIALDIEEYFSRNGFTLLQKKHITYPVDKKSTRFGVGRAYKTFDFRRGAESLTIFIVDNSEIYIEWEQFGPKFQPKPEYFEKFISLTQDELKARNGSEIIIKLIN